ncbi:ATP phosphoribosyltransferase regulatory subunit [Paracoccus sp. p4-l81]|uniref:ATP phosphoribosyltransferase regulatory subunit n=1 Tax=unclassified Paracoccus (in: a-proteobacteria) TaxID=2688777 RepID=UPI0035BA15C6
MADKPAARAVGARLLAAFTAAGAEPVEAQILLPAGRLLDLYGEDIRARAFVTLDPTEGEMMLRPDFTLPVVEWHMAGRATPARYAYLGEVFRQQAPGSTRPRESLQAGFELFDAGDPAQADAEVFALIHAQLAHLNLTVEIGDIGLLIDAVAGIDTLPARKAALLRHIWRPRRFAALLDRYAGRAPVPPSRAALLAGQAISDAPLTGLRGADEIAARIAHLHEDAAAPRLPAQVVDDLSRLFALRGPAPQALAALRDLARALPAIGRGTDRLAARLDAIAARGIDPARLTFAASHGRASMEYYDGFTFTFLDRDPGQPPVASGGRYDALTRVLGRADGHDGIPAVGGIIRPAAVARLETAPC